MLAVVADRYDAAAEALIRRWGAYDAHLLSSEDLSTAGWCHRLADTGVSTAVIDGRVICTSKITGVLTLLPWVTADQLIHIIPEDRAYVAAEMTAFFVSWLSELTCPVLNRPTPTCLAGPGWRPEQWVHAAARMEIPICPIRRSVTLAAEPLPEDAVADPPPTFVTVVGERWLGEVDGALFCMPVGSPLRPGLACSSVHFDGPGADARLLGASLRPDISSPQIARRDSRVTRRSFTDADTFMGTQFGESVGSSPLGVECSRSDHTHDRPARRTGHRSRARRVGESRGDSPDAMTRWLIWQR